MKKHPLETDVDQLLEHLHQQQQTKHFGFKKTVLVNAQNCADMNRPGLTEVSWMPYSSSITALYAGMKTDVCLVLKGSAVVQQLPAEIATYNLQIKEVQTTIDGHDEQLRQITIDKRLMSNSGEMSYRRGKQFKWVILVGEVAWLSSYFTGIADSLIVSLISAASVAAVQTVLVEKTTQKCRELPTLKARKRAYLIAGTCFAMWSLAVGIARYGIVSAYSSMPLSLSAANPVIFAFVNFLLIAACSMVVLVDYPTLKQISEIEDLAKLDEKGKALVAARNKQTAERKRLIEDRNSAVKLAEHIKHDQVVLCEKIDHYFNEALGWFVEENCTRRSDLQVPPLFANKPEPPRNSETLEFTQFNNA